MGLISGEAESNNKPLLRRFTAHRRQNLPISLAVCFALLATAAPIVVSAVSDSPSPASGGSDNKSASSQPLRPSINFGQESATETTKNTAPALQGSQANDDTSSTNHSSLYVSSSLSSSGESQSSVTVNGQSVPVPYSGTSHQVINNGDSQTNVDISSHSSTAGDDHSRTNNSTSLRVQSNTTNRNNNSLQTERTTMTVF